MQLAHIIHVHIALHKIGNRSYGADIGSEMIQTESQAPSRRRMDGGELVERPARCLGPDTPETEFDRNSERRTPPPSVPPIRLATLLLPVANHHYDARWISSPSGRYFCALRMASGRSSGIFQKNRWGQPARSRYLPNPCAMHAPRAWVPFQPGATAPRWPDLYGLHRSGDDLLLPTSPTGLAASPPPKLPIETSNARRTFSPGGRCFLRCTHSSTHGFVYLCGTSPEFSQNFAEIFA